MKKYEFVEVEGERVSFNDGDWGRTAESYTDYVSVDQLIEYGQQGYSLVYRNKNGTKAIMQKEIIND